VRPLVVKSYLGSLPAKINGEEKINALTYFAEGAAKCGDIGTTTRSQTYEECDVGAIIGNAFDANPGKVNLPHYKVRKMVMAAYPEAKFMSSYDYKRARKIHIAIYAIVLMGYFPRPESIVMKHPEKKTGPTYADITT